jgi:hypothetical protein
MFAKLYFFPITHKNFLAYYMSGIEHVKARFKHFPNHFLSTERPFLCLVGCVRFVLKMFLPLLVVVLWGKILPAKNVAETHFDGKVVSVFFLFGFYAITTVVRVQAALYLHVCVCVYVFFCGFVNLLVN